MAINATSTPKTRAKNSQRVIYSDGTESSIRWIREATIIKRVRRALAEQGKSLLKTRIGTAAHRELGEYAVINSRHEVELKLVNLRLLASNLGVLADDEAIDPPLHKGWLHYVARQTTIEIDGVEQIYNKPVTKRAYTTPEAALKAAEHIEDREGLVLCGFDAGVNGGNHDGSL